MNGKVCGVESTDRRVVPITGLFYFLVDAARELLGIRLADVQ